MKFEQPFLVEGKVQIIYHKWHVIYMP